VTDPTIVPDTKDWTWVLDRACPDCGFDAAEVPTGSLAERVRRSAAPWPALLADPSAATRHRPAAWSVLEYACHVRDVHRVMGERLRLLLTEDEPRFANWDQDATAREAAYATQAPAVVAEELLAAAEQAAAAYADVPDHAWSRRGTRSNGSEFTVATLGRYHLHDLVHHLWDVGA